MSFIKKIESRYYILADHITTIDNRFSVDHIENLHDLPTEAQKLIKETKEIRSHGFQELLGYKDRKVIWSVGGHWNAQDTHFHATSFGNGMDKDAIQWSENEMFRRSKLK